MHPRKFNILEQSVREVEKSSTESALNVGSTANARENIGPSAVHLDRPMSELVTESNNGPSTRLLDRSHPQYSTIGVPVPANGQPIEPEEREQLVNERRVANRCYAFLGWYRNAIIDFRNSYLIYIVLYLFSYIPISSIIIGLLFLHECPQTSFLPIFVTVVGVVGLMCLGIGVAVNCCEDCGTPCSKLQKIAVGILFMLLFFIMVIEMYFVSHLSPNFNPSAEDYCNKTFYYYVIGKEIASVTAIILAALLYLLGSGLYNCCQNCPVPSPAGAFFSRI